MDEDSGSSIDGEIDTSGLSDAKSTRAGASTNSALFESFSSPDVSLAKKSGSTYEMPPLMHVDSLSGNVTVRDVDTIEGDSHYEDAVEEEQQTEAIGRKKGNADGEAYSMQNASALTTSLPSSSSLGFNLVGVGDPECNLLIPACMKVNRLLFEHGYTPITLNGADIDAKERVMSVYVVDAWAESLVVALEEMFERQQVQSRAAQETSFSARSGDISREALEAHVRDLQKKLAQSEQLRASRMNEKETLEDSFERKEKSLKQSEADTKKKLKNIEMLAKESERKLRINQQEMEKMREKLQFFVERDRTTRNRYTEILSGTAVAAISKGDKSLLKSTPSPKGKIGPKSSPPTPEEVVRALDYERIDLLQQNSELREHVKSLTETIRELQNNNRRQNNNSISSDTAEVSPPKDDSEAQGGGSVKVLFNKIKDQQRRIEQLVHREGILEAESRRCEEALEMYRARSSEMVEEIENLRLELDSRPTVRAFAQKQKEVQELESRLHDVIMMRKEAAEVASWKKHLSTSDRIKADKRNHQLGLWIIESIPSTVVKELLQAACRELDISDVSELQPSIEKLKLAVTAIPRMEAFITRLCNFVFDRQPPRYQEGDQKERPVMEDVFPILKSWWSRASEHKELSNFRTLISNEVARRERALASLSQPKDFGPNAHSIMATNECTDQADDRLMKTDPNAILDVIKDLVNFQLESFEHSETFKNAGEFMAQNPEKLTNRLLAHIQYLFDVKELQGLIPRMNQVYLLNEESRNFFNSLRLVLGASSSVQTSVIIADTLKRLSPQS